MKRFQCYFSVLSNAFLIFNTINHEFSRRMRSNSSVLRVFYNLKIIIMKKTGRKNIAAM